MPPRDRRGPTWRLAAKCLPYLLLLLALALRLRGLTFQSLWRDEVDSIRFAIATTVGPAASIRSLTQAGWNGPLYTYMLGLWLRVAGTTEFAGRLSSVLPGVAGVAVCGWLGRALAGRRTSLVALALAAVSPYLIWYSQELKMYSLLFLLGAASFALLLGALRRSGWGRWAGYVALTAVIPYVHILGVLLIPAQVLAFVVAGRPNQRHWRGWLAATAVLTVPYLPLAAWQAPLLGSAFHTGHPYYPLPAMLSILARGWGLGLIASARPWLLLPYGLAVVMAVALPAWSARRRLALALLLPWIIVPVGLVFLISLRSPVFTDRYLIASLPPLLLLVALGVESLGRHSRPLAALALAALLLVGGYGSWQQARYSIKTNARGAAAIAHAGWQPGDALVLQIPYLRHSMDYYLGPGRTLVDGPYTNAGMKPEDVDLYLRSQLAKQHRVWLVLSEAPMWDSRALTAEWFQGHASQAGEWHLARLDLYLYVLPWQGN
jgi:mannosyltransferase